MPKTKPKYLAAIKNPIARRLFDDGGALENVMLGDPNKEEPAKKIKGMPSYKTTDEMAIDRLVFSEESTVNDIKIALINLVATKKDFLHKEVDGKFIAYTYTITKTNDGDDLTSLARASFADIQFNRIIEEENGNPNLISLLEKNKSTIKQKFAEKNTPEEVQSLFKKIKDAPNRYQLTTDLTTQLGLKKPPTPEESESIFNELQKSEAEKSHAPSTPPILDKPSEKDAIDMGDDSFEAAEQESFHSNQEPIEERVVHKDESVKPEKTESGEKKRESASESEEKFYSISAEDKIETPQAAEEETKLTSNPLTASAERTHIEPEAAAEPARPIPAPRIPSAPVAPDESSEFKDQEDSTDEELPIPETEINEITRVDARKIAEDIKRLYDLMNANSFPLSRSNNLELHRHFDNPNNKNKILTELIENYAANENKDNYNKLKNAVVYLQKTAEQFTKSSGRLLGGEKRDIAEVEKVSERLIEAAEREMGWKTRRGVRPQFHIQQCEYQIDIINIIIGQLMQKMPRKDNEVETLEKQRTLLNNTIQLIKNAPAKKEVRRYATHVETGTLPDTDQMNFILNRLSLAPNPLSTNSDVRMESTDTDRASKFAKGGELGESKYWIHKDTYTHNGTPFEVKSAACTINGKYTSFLNYGNALPILSDEEVFKMAAKFMLDAHSDAPDTRFKIKADPRFVKAVHLFCECSNDNIPKPETIHTIEITDADRKKMDKFLQKPENKEAITGSRHAVLSKDEEEKIKRKSPAESPRPGRNSGGSS
jgi:hypothetical protein